MWLQLFSFQNILSNQSQQRLWPLVVWVQEEEKEEEEEEEEGERTVPLKSFVSLWMWINTNT